MDYLKTEKLFLINWPTVMSSYRSLLSTRVTLTKLLTKTNSDLSALPFFLVFWMCSHILWDPHWTTKSQKDIPWWRMDMIRYVKTLEVVTCPEQCGYELTVLWKHMWNPEQGTKILWLRQPSIIPGSYCQHWETETEAASCQRFALVKAGTCTMWSYWHHNK
jgi:hypothetical protein